MTRPRRAFSLLEIVMSLGMMAVLLAISLLSARGARPEAEVSGGASALGELFVRARQQAISSGIPVAIAFPSQNGASRVAGSCYMLAGRDHARLLRVYPFGADFGKMKVYNGRYAGPSWSATAPTGLLTQVPDLTTWNSRAQDPTFYFGPDGRVAANQDQTGGDFRLVCAKEINAPGGNLAAVANPYTLSISALGAVRVEKGLLAGAPGLVTSGATTSLLASPLSMLAATNHDPVLTSPYLVVSPLPEPTSLSEYAPPGATSTVALDGFVTLETYANDPDGDELACSWTATGPAGPGVFSGAGSNAQDWNVDRDCWVSRWQWRPPANATTGELYTLSCRVSDGRGGQVVPNGVQAQIPRIATIGPRKIVIDSLYAGRPQISVCNFDGTNPQVLVSAQALKWCNYISGVSCSPGGKTVAISARNTSTGLYQVWTCSITGENLKKVMDVSTADPSLIWGCQTSWDPRGTYLYVTSVSSTWQVRIFRAQCGPLADPSPQLLATWNNGGEGRLDAHPSGKVLLFSQYNPNSDAVSAIWTDNGQVDTLHLGTLQASGCSLDVARSRFLYFEWGPNCGIKSRGYVMNAAAHTFTWDASPDITLVSGNFLYNPIMSQDGSQLLYGFCSLNGTGAPPCWKAKNMITGNLIQVNIPDTTTRDHFPAWTF